MATEDRPQTTEPGFEEWVNSIDWEAIDDQNRLRDIGCELYESAAITDKSQPGTLGVVAGLMDGFSANAPIRMRHHDGKHIADGFAKAMVRAAANAVYVDNEEDTE